MQRAFRNTRRVELLLLDLAATYIAGWAAFIFIDGASLWLSNFGTICGELGLFSVFYFLGFVVWRSYNSFSRDLSTVDTVYSFLAVLTGALLSWFWAELGPWDMYGRTATVVLQAIFAFLLVRGIRTASQLHYYHYVRRNENNGSYGLSDMALLNMEMADLLPRDRYSVDVQNIRKEISGKRILVTGGGGSIGSELVKSLALYEPSLLIVVDQAETPLHDLDLFMNSENKDVNYVSVLADIRDRGRMVNVFDTHKPQIIFHAAAYKHVSMMEQNPSECVLNNVEATMLLADLAEGKGAEKFILISSDKAVKPAGIMGCSKRIAEIYCRNMSETGARCQFITTRFGNVLGSSGSVVPLFREQIRKGGPVTVSDPDAIRYFMLVDEACMLVLEAASIGKGGEIFVFDMGKPVRIGDLLEKMIRISRRDDIKVIRTGLGKGEKLYEEVLTNEEAFSPTSNGNIKIVRVKESSPEFTDHLIKRLVVEAERYDDAAVLATMKEIVPEFRHAENK